MIYVKQAAAVISKQVTWLASFDEVRQGMCLQHQKTHSPAARYALAALALMPGPLPHPLVCLSGPTGATVEAFAKAYGAASDGRLTGAGFATRRYRKIHPFTLLRSLQNQVAAVIAMEHGLRGPSINALESATALAYLLPSLRALLRRHNEVLLVMTSAGDRLEELAKFHCFQSETATLEGAVCFVLSSQSGVGEISAAHPAGEEPSDREIFPSRALTPFAPALAGGLALLQCFLERNPSRVIQLSDFSGHEAHIQWSMR